MPTAIVTGASMGLGEALAHGLARAGWSLVIDARGEAALSAVAASLQAELAPGARLTALPGDVTDPTHRAVLVGAATAAGGLDLVVNNASTLGPSPLPPLTRLPARRPPPDARDQPAGPAGPDPGRGPRLAPGRPAPGDQRHLRRLRRGLPGLGRLRRLQGRPGPPGRRAWPPKSPSGGCGRSTPATCAPACTRRPSRARTSPTGPSRRRWCPPCWPSSSPTGPRAGCGWRTWYRRRAGHDPGGGTGSRGAAAAAARSVRSGSFPICPPNWKPPRPPEARGLPATACACWWPAARTVA